MPRGLTECPICGGRGKITEDADVYDFVTRDPLTERCHICSGTGQVGYMTKLPDGRLVKDIAKAIKEAAPAVGELAKKSALKPGDARGSKTRAIKLDAKKPGDAGKYSITISGSPGMYPELCKAIYMALPGFVNALGEVQISMYRHGIRFGCDLGMFSTIIHHIGKELDGIIGMGAVTLVAEIKGDE